MPERDGFAKELRGDEDGMHQNNYGFSKFFEWLMGGAMLLIIALLCWFGGTVISLKTDIAVLKERPAPVSQEAFEYRMKSVEQRLSSLEAKKR